MQYRVIIRRGAAVFLRECAVEVSALLGFRSTSMVFPVLHFEDDAVVASVSELHFFLQAEAGMDCAFRISRRGSRVDLRLQDEAGIEGLFYALCSSFDQIEGSTDFEIGAADPTEPSGSSDRVDGTRPFADAQCPGIMEGGYHHRSSAQGLEAIFEREYLVKDEDYDFLPDRIDASIALPEEFDDFELSAACDVAARLGMESLGLELPILAREGRPRGALIRIVRSNDCRVTLHGEFGMAGATGEMRIIDLLGEGEALASMASALCGRFPGTGDPSPLADLCADLRLAVAFRSLDGQLAWLDASDAPAGTVAYVEPRVESRRPALEARFPGVEFRNRETLEPICDREIELPWELDSCRALLEREVYPRLGPEEGADILVVLSEDRPTCAALEEEIRATVIARGARCSRVRVVCAFKQGLSWMRDYVLPELVALGGVDSVEIGFSAFLPEGREAWTDEDGATPAKISANRPADPDFWFDPPIRLLQELYPVDDLVASALSIGRERITFSVHPRAGALGYRIIARDRGGAVVYEDSYEVSMSERPYLDDFPEIGKVHPGTGRVALSRDGKPIWEERFKTDMESVWDAYQREVLPECRSRAELSCGGKVTAAGQPFFAQLRVEVEASEPDEALGIRQDRVSSLESLHEDIYFTGLNYFQTLGVKAEGKGFDSPGLILPVIRRGEGRPRMRFSILAERPGGAAFETAGERNVPPYAAIAGDDAVEAFVEELVYDPSCGAFSPLIRLRVPELVGQVGGAALADPAAFLRSYAHLLSEGLLDASWEAAGIPLLRFALGDGPVVDAVPPAPEPEPPAEDIRGIDLMESRLIGCDEYRAIAERLRRVAGIRVRKVAESHQGRDILAIEFPPRLPGYISRTKLVASRPSVYINARHHANEISSTNSALALVRRLLTDEAYEGVADRVNIVIVPFENPDGAAIQYELAADNPEWILHAARYNSLGKEFSYDYFRDDTPHGEARACTQVWRDWLPDVVVDDHGVPNHEWCQQFSGYTSPWFKGFWMPRALLYGYFWYVTDEAYAENKTLAERIQEVVADRIGSEPGCRALNAEWRDRFEKYAHAWMPRVFPAEYHKDVIFYWVPYAYKREASVRYPWVTASTFVTEVADETARGEYLGLCARTHEVGDLAVIDLLCSLDARVESEVRRGGAAASTGGWIVSARLTRKRPPAGERSG